MKKIKDKINNLKKLFKQLLSKFLITILTVFITSVICSVSINTDFINSNTFINIILFATIFAVSTFLIETITKKIEKKNILYYILSAILALLLTYATNIKHNILGIENSIFISRIVRFIICYVINIILIAIYFLYKNSNQNFAEYLLHVTINIFKSTIIYGILAIGIAVISAIFIFLILEGNYYSLILRLEILLLGFCYIPRVIYSFYNIENEISKFARVVIKYVLEILVIIAFAIIYLYIAKILILKDIPSNQIFRIVAVLFAIGCPIWTMASYFNDDTLLDKINKKLPILFIPFILLQMYTIGIRIINNGVTEARYLCVMLIIFEIIYTIIYLKNKEKVGNILLTLVVLILISLIVPYINMYKFSIISQCNNLKIYKNKTTYTQNEKDKIIGAYYYLEYSEEGDKIIQKYLNQNDIDNIKNFKKNNVITSNIEYISADTNLKSINVEEYVKLYFINDYNYFEEKGGTNVEDAFKNVKVNEKENTLNLSNLMMTYILNKNDSYQYFEENNETILNENQKIIINRFYIRYNLKESKVLNYSIEGYLLEK